MGLLRTIFPYPPLRQFFLFVLSCFFSRQARPFRDPPVHPFHSDTNARPQSSVFLSRRLPRPVFQAFTFSSPRCCPLTVFFSLFRTSWALGSLFPRVNSLFAFSTSPSMFCQSGPFLVHSSRPQGNSPHIKVLSALVFPQELHHDFGPPVIFIWPRVTLLALIIQDVRVFSVLLIVAHSRCEVLLRLFNRIVQFSCMSRVPSLSRKPQIRRA